MDDLFGKKQPGTTTGGPDPNDKDKYDRFRKAGKKYDKNGKQVDNLNKKMQRMDSNGTIAFNEPTHAFMNFKQTFDGLRDQGFGNAAPFRMLHEYMGQLQNWTF